MSNNTTTIPYVIKTNGSVTLYLNDECLTVAPDHPNYNKILENIKAGDFSQIESLVNVAKAVTSYASGRISIINGEIFYSGFVLSNTLTQRILKMMTDGFKFDHMMKFLENIMQNPSKRAVDETYWFLENYGLPITDDGCFLAYKAVRNNYTDIYSGKFNNAIGAVVSMPRNMVDDNYGKDCSNGLHVGALDYVVGYGHFRKGEAPAADGNRLLIVKVNPKDVVSVPQYEGHTKMRVCEYTVVSEIKDIVKELDKVVYTGNGQELQSDWDATESDDDNYRRECPWFPDEDCHDQDDGDYSDDQPDENDLEESYKNGYDQGQHDRNFGLEYQTNLPEEADEKYRSGYSDGFYDF